MPADAVWLRLLSDCVVKSSVVLLAGWGLAALLKRRPAPLRHLVWTAAIFSLPAIPAVAYLAPAWNVPVSTVTVAADGPTFRTQAVALGDLPRVAAGERLPDPGTYTPARTASARNLVFCVWAGGVLLSLLPLIAGAVAVRLRRRGAVAVPATAWEGMVPELAAAIGIQRSVRVFLAGAVHMPMSIGLLRPAVVLPAEATGWPRERLRMVLLHELAHVKRRDCLTHTLARLACALYWFQPLAWFAARQAVKERERACDDLVLAAGTRPSAYAAELLHAARTMAAPNWAWGAIAMARPSQLEGRLLAILDERIRRGAPGVGAVVCAMVLTLFVLVPLASIRPVQAQVAAPNAALPALRAPEPVPQTPVADGAEARLVKEGDVAASQGKQEEAFTAYARAAEAQKKAYGADSMEYAAAALRAGRYVRAHGDFKNAENLFLAALPVYERVYGQTYAEIADIYEYLGSLALQRSSFDKAREYYNRSLQLYTRAGGERGAGAARLTALLGELDLTQGNTESAERQVVRAIALAGDEQPDDRALALEIYTQVLTKTGRKGEAAKTEAEALSIRSRAVEKAFKTPDSPQPGLKVGGDVLAPRPVVRPEPQYSELAWAARVQGTAVYSVLIGPDGLIKAATLKRSAGFGLDAKGVETLRGWKFEPGMRDGQPVTVAATIEVNFRLM